MPAADSNESRQPERMRGGFAVFVQRRCSQVSGGLSSSSNTAKASLSAQQGIHPGFERGESPVLLPQLLGFAPQLFHPQPVLHLALLVVGIPSPVEQRQPQAPLGQRCTRRPIAEGVGAWRRRGVLGDSAKSDADSGGSIRTKAWGGSCQGSVRVSFSQVVRAQESPAMRLGASPDT